VPHSRGRFIVLDGPDGAGKTTQAALLRDRLEERGLRVLLLREPGGTKAGEAIRGLLLEHRHVDLSPLAEAFLFQAARAQLVGEVIRPALARGLWVVCDRFTLSTQVYQGVAGSEVATGGLRPDLYCVLCVSPRVGLARRADRAADRMEAKGRRFTREVFAAYAREARRFPKRYRLVDGAAAPAEVQARIWAHVERLLP
jgi:dTMP kinase